MESSQFQNAAARGAVAWPDAVRDGDHVARMSSVLFDALEVKVRSAAPGSLVSSTNDSWMVTIPVEGTSAFTL